MTPAAMLEAEGRGPGGTTETAEGVFRRYADRVYQLALRMLNNEADAEDVVQEVLLQVTRKLDTFRGEAALTTWLHRVTVNAALAYRRKRAQFRPWQAHDALDELVTDGGRVGAPRPPALAPDQQALRREDRRLIDRALARVPEMYRVPVVLSDIEGLSNAEIGAALGLSLPAVKSRLHRGRQFMRRLLSHHFEPACD
jgi:RNA polymerase sigma-70 factor (ECF subfamily)